MGLLYLYSYSTLPQLLPLPRDNEETHEPLSAVQVLTSTKEKFLIVNGSGKKKYFNIFLQNQLTVF